MPSIVSAKLLMGDVSTDGCSDLTQLGCEALIDLIPAQAEQIEALIAENEVPREYSRKYAS